MTTIELPIIGQGSQPAEEDGAALEYMQMPEQMTTYAMPEIAADLSGETLQPAKDLLHRLLEQLSAPPMQASPNPIELSYLGRENLSLVNQVIGEGEVSIVYHGGRQLRIQESILAGVWRLQTLDSGQQVIEEVLEVGAIPTLVAQRTFSDSVRQITLDEAAIPAGVMNAPSLIGELNAKITNRPAGAETHVINLSLLPHTEQDLQLLDRCLGTGSVTILSRGYGNCRITSTAVCNVWWVQYFNSQDTLILNTLEVTEVPAVACAAAEDIEDSRERLREILEIL